jgi:hypothetical protein
MGRQFREEDKQMANRNEELTSSTSRKTQIKTTMRCHHTVFRMAKIKTVISASTVEVMKNKLAVSCKTRHVVII